MIISQEVQNMCPVAQGVHHGAAPIPEEAKWVKAKEVKDISGFTHGVGWCAPQQGACKLTLNVKEGIIQEALVETIGCSGMTHSAAMASEILPGLTVMEALNTDLVCDAINTAMRELFLQIVYGRSISQYTIGPIQSYHCIVWNLFKFVKIGKRPPSCYYDFYIGFMNLLQRFDSRLRNAVSVETHQCSVYI